MKNNLRTYLKPRGAAHFISKQKFVGDFCEFHRRIIVELQDIWNSSWQTWVHSQEVFHFTGIRSKYENCFFFCLFPRLYSHSFSPSLPRSLLCQNLSLMPMIRYRLHGQIAPVLLLSLVFFRSLHWFHQCTLHQVGSLNLDDIVIVDNPNL